ALSRRLFLQRGAIAGAALGGGFLPGFARRALAQGASGKVFVFLFLRGALDGLSVVVPNGDGRLAQLRPQLTPPSGLLDGGARGRSVSRRAFETLYEGAADEPVGASGKEAFAAVELLERKLGEARLRGGEAGYPNGYLGQSMRLLAALIKADVGLRVGFAEAGGWDTHAAQPAVLERNLGDLAKALAAFRADLGARFDDVLLV